MSPSSLVLHKFAPNVILADLKFHIFTPIDSAIGPNEQPMLQKTNRDGLYLGRQAISYLLNFIDFGK